MKEFLTKQEVADLLGCHIVTISRKMKSGELPYIKLSNTRRGIVRFKKEDVEAFIRKNVKGVY